MDLDEFIIGKDIEVLKRGLSRKVKLDLIKNVNEWICLFYVLYIFEVEFFGNGNKDIVLLIVKDVYKDKDMIELFE